MDNVREPHVFLCFPLCKERYGSEKGQTSCVCIEEAMTGGTIVPTTTDMDDIDDQQAMDACPIDLSTKKFDQTLFGGDQRSRLLESLASLTSPQNILSLCAHLAASRDATRSAAPSEASTVAQEASTAPAPLSLECPATGCEK
ncbi:hypothetical protein GCK32_019535, partial [Trichostrongylus colubriformis]